MNEPRRFSVTAGVLEVACLEWGPADGWPCILGHGFPYDAHVYAEAAPIIAAEGARVIAPWLRGYGETRFLSPETPRSGEQASLGADMLALMDALGIERAVLGGYDWGGRAAWDWLTASGSHPNIFCEMDSPETIAILVDQGMGVALLPDWRGLRQRHPDLTCTEIEALPARRIVLMSLQPAPAEQLLTLVAQILRGRDRPVVCPPGGGGE